MQIKKYIFNQYAWKDNVDMPRGARILSAVLDRGYDIFLFALVDPEAPPEPRGIMVIGVDTEMEYPSSARFIGTVFSHPDLRGAEVHCFHVFELPEPVA